MHQRKKVCLMQEAGIVVPAAIDAKTFRDFAVFDSFIRQKRWRMLSLFTCIMLGSAIICFIMRGRAEQAVLLGGVLTAVGLGLPVAYLLSFFLSIKTQSEKMRLKTQRHAYTLTMMKAEGIEVKAGKELLKHRWEEVFAVYRWRTYTYLYVSQQKAYLMPDQQVPGSADALWRLLEGSVPAGRLFDLRRKKQHTGTI
jgi:hypothetical protein